MGWTVRKSESHKLTTLWGFIYYTNTFVCWLPLQYFLCPRALPTWCRLPPSVLENHDGAFSGLRHPHRAAVASSHFPPSLWASPFSLTLTVDRSQYELSVWRNKMLGCSGSCWWEVLSVRLYLAISWTLAVQAWANLVCLFHRPDLPRVPKKWNHICICHQNQLILNNSWEFQLDYSEWKMDLSLWLILTYDFTVHLHKRDKKWGNLDYQFVFTLITHCSYNCQNTKMFLESSFFCVCGGSRD